MGMFNTYGTSQIKAGDVLDLRKVEIGERADLPDGIYPGAPNFIVIYEGKFVAELDKLFDYWGELPVDSNTICDFVMSRDLS